MTPADDMSDFMRDDGRPARLAPTMAFEVFRASDPDAFEGIAEGVSLANRLQAAFQHGWAACERAVKKAMEGR